MVSTIVRGDFNLCYMTIIVFPFNLKLKQYSHHFSTKKSIANMFFSKIVMDATICFASLSY